MNKQYIGARYVIKIYQNTTDPSSAEWQENTSYEALVLVTYQYSSYLSKKPVPASVGNPASNPEYWVVTGAYNGQIASLSDRITELETQLPLLDGRVDTIEDEMPTLLSDVSTLKTTVAKNLSVKNQIVIFGDSWADEPHDPDVAMNSVLADRLACTVHNYAYGGTGFDVPNGYDEQITWMQADLDNDEYSLDNVKCIILVCGLNDHYGGANASQFRTRLQDWYDKIIAATTGYEIPIYWFQNYSIENDLTQTNITTFARQRQYYIDVMTGFEGRLIYVPTFGFIKSWKNDRHPNADGHKTLAWNMVNIINGEPPKMYAYQTIVGTINDETITGTEAEVDITFWCNFGGSIFKSYMDISAHSLYAVASGTEVTYSHTAPAVLKNRVIADYKYMGDNNYERFKIYSGGTSAYTGLNGRYEIEVQNDVPNL